MLDKRGEDQPSRPPTPEIGCQHKLRSHRRLTIIPRSSRGVLENSSYPQSYLPRASLLPSYRDPVPFGGDGAGEERRVQMVVQMVVALLAVQVAVPPIHDPDLG